MKRAAQESALGSYQGDGREDRNPRISVSTVLRARSIQQVHHIVRASFNKTSSSVDYRHCLQDMQLTSTHTTA